MTELLPGPEDAGKHLFEISPGRPECLSALCGGLVVVTPMGGVTAPPDPEGQTSFRMFPCRNISTVSKDDSEIWAESRDYGKFGRVLENPAN